MSKDLTLIYMAPWVHIEYSIPEFKKCNFKLMKALLFRKFKNICWKTKLWTRITIVSLFLYIGTLGDMTIQSCEYHINEGTLSDFSESFNIPRCLWHRGVSKVMRNKSIAKKYKTLNLNMKVFEPMNHETKWVRITNHTVSIFHKNYLF